ncbi:MAG TPA: ParB-like protein [Anaeromyxobacter sp.]|nr:ParB-like protein [Anaeromyxobacter sp.]HVO17815.1 ParB-like protein [Anaeromyxobacter sp.]
MPHARQTPIRALHPTQLTVGMAEVKEKRDHLAGLSAPERERFMEGHPIPAVVGPGGRLFIIDHHHLGRAALEAGLKVGYVEVAADLSGLAGDAFWTEMDKRAWVHPLDQNGVRHRYDRIPQRLEGLVDDVYRSLAGLVRAGGGYEKTPSPFAEFEWADYFRRLIPVEEVEADLGAAVKVAVRHALSERARGMPGYCGKA